MVFIRFSKETLTAKKLKKRPDHWWWTSTKDGAFSPV